MLDDMRLADLNEASMIGFGTLLATWIGVGFFHVSGSVSSVIFLRHVIGLTAHTGWLASSDGSAMCSSTCFDRPSLVHPRIASLALHARSIRRG